MPKWLKTENTRKWFSLGTGSLKDKTNKKQFNDMRNNGKEIDVNGRCNRSK